MAVAAGTKLGRYEIRSQIGAGGMGEVYLAQDTELERTVALKDLPAEVASDKRLQEFASKPAKTSHAPLRFHIRLSLSSELALRWLSVANSGRRSLLRMNTLSSIPNILW